MVLRYSAVCLFLVTSFAAGEESLSFRSLAERYQSEVRPLMQRFCLDCHSARQREGELDLEQFGKLTDVRRSPETWLRIVEMLDNGEMPPDGSTQPSVQEKMKLRGWIEGYLRTEARAGAGDPGRVVLRRLTNAEYRYTTLDLTGVDLNPARDFPTNSAAGEGFTNTGIAMVMSPAMLQKYFDAGTEIAAHAVLLPDGFRFSRHSSRDDWRNEILTQIREFYSQFVSAEKLGDFQSNLRFSLGQAGSPPLEKYLAATLDERTAITTGKRSIATVAGRRGLNARYLNTLWSSLTESKSSLILDKLRSHWRGSGTEDAEALVAEIVGWQEGLWTFGPVGLYGKKGAPARWMQPVNPLVTQQNIRLSFEISETSNPANPDEEELVISLVVTDAGDGNDHDFVVFQQPRLVVQGQADIYLKSLTQTGLDPGMFGSHPDGRAIDTASICVQAPSVVRFRLPVELATGREFVTTAVLEQETGLEGSVQVLPFRHSVGDAPSIRSGLVTCEVDTEFTKTGVLVAGRDRNVSFSGAILVSDNSTARRRIETAMDDYRSVFPAALCYTQIVPVDEILTMTLFHREDNHLVRLMLDEEQIARLDRLWEELLYVSHSPLMRLDAMELVLEVLAGNEAPDFKARYNLFKPMHAPLVKRAAEFRQTLVRHESVQIDVLIDFAGRAWRRPLTDVEVDRLRELYHQLRRQDLSHDEAFRLTLARVFVASPFLYRFENVPAGSGTTEVSEWELANRLSYFLWSSMPDMKLREAARKGQLVRSPQTIDTPGNTDTSSASGKTHAELLRQTTRMLSDARVRGLATEFACQWMDTYQFGSLGRKSEKYFPEFLDIRGDLHEESILFFTDLFRNDGSLLSLLEADHTFVNERLARFYGIPQVEGSAWRRVDGMHKYGRGGILGMAVTLAKHSGAARTSPILRGNWVSEVLLGEKLPRPPKNVPQLAATVPEGLTERQLIEQHSSDPACAKCHVRIDPFGFALEKFDTVGRRRGTDALIDVRTTLPDGTSIQGLSGLRDYLLNRRRNTFVYQFCRKFLGYALGREVQLSDEPLLEKMQRKLRKNDYRVSVAVKTIVLSDQFRRIRGMSYNR